MRRMLVAMLGGSLDLGSRIPVPPGFGRAPFRRGPVSGHGRIQSIELVVDNAVFDRDEQSEPTAAPLLRSLWGTPVASKDGYDNAVWTWRKPDRTITYDAQYGGRLTIEDARSRQSTARRRPRIGQGARSPV